MPWHSASCSSLWASAEGLKMRTQICELAEVLSSAGSAVCLPTRYMMHAMVFMHFVFGAFLAFGLDCDNRG